MHKNITRYSGVVFSSLFFILALTVLYHELRDYHLYDIISQLKKLSSFQVFVAVLLTILNYLVMTGYDFLAFRFINHPVTYRKIAAVSLISYAFSNNMGLFMFGGAPVRYRLYSPMGLSTVEITNVVIFCSLSLWIGFLTLGGIAFLMGNLTIPHIFDLPLVPVRLIGILFLSLVIMYLLTNTLRKEPLKIGRWSFPLIPVNLSLLQILFSAADWALAGLILYLFLPSPASLSYPEFLGVFLLSQCIGIVSTVPGGLGVFETIMLIMLSPVEAPASIVAALLLFRGIYYLLPLALSIAAMVAGEIIQRMVVAGKVAHYLGGWVSRLAPHALSFATFASGMILLFSVATPPTHGRLAWLTDFVPLPILELSHFLASLSGIGLILLARGLQRRLDGAYILTVILLGSGAVFALLKGVDYEEAILLTVMFIALLNARHHFYRKSSLLNQRFTPGWIAAVTLAMLASLGLGLFAFRHVEYAHDLWWQFAFSGDAPRSLRAMVGSLSVILFFALAKLLSPAVKKPQLPGRDELGKAKLVIEKSSGTNGYLAFLEDKALLFNKGNTAFIMYGVERRSWVAMGDPIGPASEHEELIWQFREFTDRYDGWLAFYQIHEANIPTYVELGLALLKLGEEGIVPLADFSLADGKKSELRRTLHKFDRQGYTFEIIPKAQVPLLLHEFRSISDAWLAEKHVREKGFSLGFFKEEYLSLFPAAVVRKEGKIIAFANLLSGAEEQELSLDLMRHYPDAPNGTMDYLFTNLMLWGKEAGYQRFMLGMAPLAGISDNQLTPFIGRLGAFLYRHGEHFYNFQGLRDYKDKFGPQWEPRYLASPGGFSLPLVITDIAALISRGLKGVILK
ncbi:MAG: bifunctional lysylphosphatidylglycerol flippase/synthetase MprF [Syntrophales bacterium]